MIFLGSGDYSKTLVEQAHKDLDSIIELVGGMQQPCHCSLPDCGSMMELIEEEKKLLQERVKKLVFDLTGMDIVYA